MCQLPALLALLALWALVPAMPLAAQVDVEEEDLGEREMTVFVAGDPEPLPPALEREATRLARQPPGDDPLSALEATIVRLAPIADGGNPPIAARRLLARLLAWRAALVLELDDRASAESDLRRALMTDPALELDDGALGAPGDALGDALGNDVGDDLRDGAGVSLFDDELRTLLAGLRRELVGTLRFTALDPPDPQLVIDGRRVALPALPALDGEAGGAEVAVLAGSRRISARRAGYAPAEAEVEVPAGGAGELELVLERTGAVLRLFTRPAGATVLIDQQPRGVTEGRAIPAALPRLEAAEAATFSSAFVLTDLPLGRHGLEIAAAGYRPYRATLEIQETIDYEIPPIVLEPERGALLLRALPATAKVLIDGRPAEGLERRGTQARLSLPPGRYQLIVEDGGPAAMFARSLTVADRQTVEVEVRLRPGLALLGAVGGGGGDGGGSGGGSGGRAEQFVREAFAGSEVWTVIDHTARSPALLAGLGLDAARLARAAEDDEDVDWAALQAAAGRDLSGMLYVLPVVIDDLLAPRVELLIWPPPPGPARPDAIAVDLDAPQAASELVARFDRSLRLRRPWLGAQVIDSDGALHPVVASVVPGSPADAAGVRAGDHIVSVAQVPVLVAAALDQRIAAAEIGEPVTVGVRRPEGSMTVQLTLGSSPLILDGRDRAMAPAIAFAVLGLLERRAADDRWIASLDRAKLLMAAGDWVEAARALRAIQAPPGGGSEGTAGGGVGQATVDYWLGVALTAAGPSYREAAIDAFERAAAVSGARLEHHDGPWLAPRARARLAELRAR